MVYVLSAAAGFRKSFVKRKSVSPYMTRAMANAPAALDGYLQFSGAFQ
jgi:hypothetical protein